MENIKEKKPIIGFTKESIVKSAKYRGRRDVLSALLDDNRRYSHKQVKEILDQFDKKGVK